MCTGIYKNLAGKSERKRQFGKLRHGWEDTIVVIFQVLTAASIKLRILGCTAVLLIGCRPTIQRCVLSPSSGR
jgi:hypothetical protein